MALWTLVGFFGRFWAFETRLLVYQIFLAICHQRWTDTAPSFFHFTLLLCFFNTGKWVNHNWGRIFGDDGHGGVYSTGNSEEKPRDVTQSHAGRTRHLAFLECGEGAAVSSTFIKTPCLDAVQSLSVAVHVAQLRTCLKNGSGYMISL